MGAARWRDDDWSTRSTVNKSRPTTETFKSRTIDPSLDPRNFKIRESRDSVQNPKSTPLIVALDVTGSMGMLAHNIAKEGLGVIVGEVLKRKPIVDPHLMFMGIGDASPGYGSSNFVDQGPIQVTQFEADIRVLDQVEKIWIEGGGGGNDHESYDFPWLVAATRCVTDSWEVRRKKGYLFTVGDEMPPVTLTHAALQRFLGEGEGDITSRQSLEMAQKCWEVYHIVVAEGSYARSHDPRSVVAAWQNVLGQHVIRLDDHTKLAEVIVSALQVAEGDSFEEVVKSWSGGTSVVVRDAIKGLPSRTLPSERV